MSSEIGLHACDIDVREVMTYIPHRYPMLMVDRLIELEPFKRAVAVKAVSIGEPYFQGHFPQRPIMPGVMIVESMAQAAGIMVVASNKSDMQDKLIYFMSIDEAKFRHPVTPGVLLHIHVERVHSRGLIWKFAGRAYVEDKLMAEARFTAMVRNA